MILSDTTQLQDMPGTNGPSSGTEIAELAQLMDRFVAERNWQKYHDPKSLLLAMMGEVGELAECFQWLPADQATQLVAEPSTREAVEDEVADVFLYLLRLCSVCNIDLAGAARRKMVKNARKYPVQEVLSGRVGPRRAGGQIVAEDDSHPVGVRPDSDSAPRNNGVTASRPDVPTVADVRLGDEPRGRA